LEAEEKAKEKYRNDLWYEGRPYLFNERRDREANEKEEEEVKEEERKQKEADEYIEQYYGNDYAKDLEKYPVNTDPRNMTLQKFGGVIPNKR